MKIVVDAFGGDFAPIEVVKGAVLAVKERKDITVVLAGDENKIKEILGEVPERIEILNASDVISNDDTPTLAIRQKKDSSLVRAFDLLKEDDEVVGLVSAGSTGAVLTGAILKIGRIKGISRPALCPILPTVQDGKSVMICDSGANVDCKSEHLLHFAIMASAYCKAMGLSDNPKVALLNNGAEEHKGNELTKSTYPLMKNLPINFVGNVEAREVMSGDVDVIVADGFAGNVLLKSVEGVASGMSKLIKKEAKKNIFASIGALMMGKFKGIKAKMDINKFGGAPFLGCKKLVVKTHGTAKKEVICNTILQVAKLHENKLVEKIEELVSQMTNKMESVND
ncbi:MAG: phosphate acyltransferase PlsX [Candidatus Caccovivens sp.]